MSLNRNMPRVQTDHFALVPQAEIPRSTFVTEHSYKTAFNAGDLIPIFCDEVLPADHWKGQVTIFARLATPTFPIMDNITLETFFFFTPSRIVWDNFRKMMGERKNPSDSISYTIPQTVSPTGGWAVASIFDYFGLPVAGQVDAASTISVNALPLRAYNLIWNEWFRDENLQTQASVATGDGPDTSTVYVRLVRNKKHDYFTSALPWPIKGGVEVSMPLSGNANVKGIGMPVASTGTAGTPGMKESGGTAASGWTAFVAGSGVNIRLDSASSGANPVVYADLSTATGATINALRTAFQTQRLLERDARSGSRYTELLRAHFGVTPEDIRLQRPEYIGGGRMAFQTQAIPQTSATGLTGGTSQLGSLGAAASGNDQHHFSYASTEHGYIIGLAHVGADVTYQQGLRRMWTKSTRYDIYWPVFAHLGEQAIRNDEIYCTGISAQDTAVFGYQERWAEYRQRPSMITGILRSTAATNIDEWHLAQQFSSLPTLGTTFIADASKAVITRALAAGSTADNQQVIFDSVFRIATTRALPMYSVPGQIDRF